MSGGSMDRRAFIGLGAGILGVAAAPAWLRPRERLHRLTVPLMGTVAEFAVPSRSEAVARRAMQAAAAELQRVEWLMSRFRPDSEVGRYNAAAPGARVVLGGETAGVVREALGWAGRSHGVFDPTLARLSAAWDPAAGTPPGPTALARLRSEAGGWQGLAAELPATGAATVAVDGAVTVKRLPASALDLGGIAKGYGVDRAAAVLREHGVFRGLVNVGGDLMALGDGPGGRPWRVGVRDPRDPSTHVRTLEVVDRAVATSGDYLRFFEHDGRRYHHILNPDTGAPVDGGVRTVTVVADDVMTADAAATTAFVHGPGGARGTLAAAPGRPRIAHSG